ncbi:Gas vesicle synthesis protein GvpL/GvpF [Micromonospora pallida]|uniref:Gas vesicle synthesis protein GvpL/GvpF n=1 Tax=Micromonospora pallida TaxID=145854 RepID=A0A1C6TEM9_9ACTN|nr:GvpL/GvpF family gas vesicle protein [Micromonospora pallida]SCL40246.1 Gas vesicle synthesis protein GvpL/GvpF [Micromonospora pallida]
MSADPVVPTTPVGTGTWLHGIVPASVAGTLSAVTGLTDTPVRTVHGAGLAAVFSAVPLDEYGEQPLRRNLEDLGWLERTARAHHRVVDALARTGPVVPARLATVHTDERRLAALLHERQADLVATLARLAGHQEWGVKGYLVPAAPAAEPAPGDATARPAEAGSSTPRPAGTGLVGDGNAAPPSAGAGNAAARPAGGGGAPSAAGGTGAGAAYLRRRRAQLQARETGQQVAAQSAAAVHEELAGHAAEARRHAPQDQRLSGDSRPMVLNGAYLVPLDRLAGFRTTVAALAARHPTLRLELTGPWPPYSFIAGQPGS